MPVFLLPILAFLRTHWRSFATIGVAILAFADGWRSAPKPQTKTVTVEKVQWKDRIVTQTVEKRVEVRAEAKTTVIYRDRIVNKDGSSETREKVVQNVDTTDHTAAVLDAHASETHEGNKTTEATKIVETLKTPTWLVNVGVGTHLSFDTPFVIAGVSKRVLGPFNVGIWGSLDIKGKNPALGVSVGVAF